MLHNQRFAGSCACILLAALTVQCSIVGASPVAPTCIPPVKQYTPLPGTFTLDDSTSIVVEPSQLKACGSTARLLAHSLFVCCGIHPAITTSAPRSGYIVLRLNPRGHSAITEGYRLEVRRTVTITSTTTHGLFNGTRTLVQYLHRGRSIPDGITKDWPDYPFRGLMIDVARKYFTIRWLKDEIRNMANVKMDELHLHLTDDEGFRIQSTSHPELNSFTSPVYTHNQIAELVQYGRRYHVEIIPEIDFPAHCGAILKVHPEFRLVSPTGTTLENDMDITKPGAISLVKDLLHEYLTLFLGKYWHCGGDEYLHRSQYAHFPQLGKWAICHLPKGARPTDTFISFINEEDAIVRGTGKTMRAWADTYEFQGSNRDPVTLNNDICQELWNGYDNPSQIIHFGFKVSNASYPLLYYNVGDGTNLSKEQAENIISQWNPRQFYQHDGTWLNIAPSPSMQGACYHVWADDAKSETEQTIAQNIQMPLCAMALKCWDSDMPSPSIAKFETEVRALGPLGSPA